MTITAPWCEQDFTDLLETPGTFLTPWPSPFSKYANGGARGGETPSHSTAETAQSLQGFALGRIILDEAELLTLAVDPSHQRQGLGQALLAGFEAEANARGARTAFLEVAATNTAARALYERAGWVETGRRTAYYAATPARIDAILMTRALASA